MADITEGHPLWVYVPAGAGLFLALKRFSEAKATGLAASILESASKAGRVVRQVAREKGLIGIQEFSRQDAILASLYELAASGKWKTGLREGIDIRTAIAHATRRALYAEPRLSAESIDDIVESILGRTGSLFKAVEPVEESKIFEYAIKKVAEHGSPGVFLNAFEEFRVAGFPPGEFLSPDTIRKIVRESYKTGHTARILSWSDVIRRKDTGLFLREVLSKKEVEFVESALLSKLQSILPKEARVDIPRIHTFRFGDTIAKSVEFEIKGLGPRLSILLPAYPKGFFVREGNLYTMPKVLMESEKGAMEIPWAQYYLSKIDEANPILQDILNDHTLSAIEKRRRIKRLFLDIEKEATRYLTWMPTGATKGAKLRALLEQYSVAVPSLSAEAVRAQGLTSEEVNRIFGKLYKAGYAPPPSPSGLEVGKVLPSSLSGSHFWAYGTEFPIEKRPWQFLREFSPTAEVIQMLKQQKIGGMFSRYMPVVATERRLNMLKHGYVGPQMLVGYMLPKSRIEIALSKGRELEKENILIKRSLMKLFKTEAETNLLIDLSGPIANKSFAKWLEMAVNMPPSVTSNRPFQLIPGQLIGHEIGTGKALYAADLPGFNQAVVGVQVFEKEGKPVAKLIVKNRFSSSSYVKLFGPVKVTTVPLKDQSFYKMMRDFGLPFRDIDALVFADQIAKNPALIKEQMTSGLIYLAGERYKTLSALSKLTKEEQRQLKLAKRLLKMSPVKRAEAFKTAPEVVKAGLALGVDVRYITGMLEYASEFPAEEIAAVRKLLKGSLVHPSGIVLGMISPHVGAYSYTMGGGILAEGAKASMEPRGFLSLLQHNWPTSKGNLSHLLAAELLRAMKVEPGRLQHLTNIISSLAGIQPEGLESISIANLSKFELRNKPYLLKLGEAAVKAGAPKAIYVPEEEAMKRLASFRTTKGQIMATDLYRRYEDLFEAAKYGDEKAVAQAVSAFREAALNEIGAALFGRGGGSEMTGALRGQLTGGLYAPLQPAFMASPKLGPFEAEVSQAMAKRMFEDMFRNATSAAEKRFLKEQYKALQEGKQIAAVLGRHPFIGLHSIQPVKIRLAKGKTSAEELFVRMSSYQTRIARTTIGRLEVPLNPLLGLAADYDDDRVWLKMIGDRQTAQAAMESLRPRAGIFTKSYKKFSAEAVVLKELAKKQIAKQGLQINLPEIDKIILGSAKLRTGKVDTGIISAALTQAKLAVAQYMPGEFSRQFGLLAEVMEQTIISGKKMTNISQNMAEAVASSIYNIGRPEEVKKLAKISKEIFGDAIEKGINIRMGKQKWVFKINFEEMWQNVQRAMLLGNEKGGVLSAYKMLQRGKMLTGEQSIREVLSIINAAKEGRGDILTNLATATLEETRGVGKGVEMARTAMAEVAEGIKKVGAHSAGWGKPLLYGLLATTALMLLSGAPEPKPMPGPPPPALNRKLNRRGEIAATHAMLAPQQSYNRRTRPEDMPLPYGGNPVQAPVPFAPGSVYIEHPSYANIRTNIDVSAIADMQGLRYNLHALSATPHYNVDIMDGRMPLTAQKISEQMEDEV